MDERNNKNNSEDGSDSDINKQIKDVQRNFKLPKMPNTPKLKF